MMCSLLPVWLLTNAVLCVRSWWNLFISYLVSLPHGHVYRLKNRPIMLVQTPLQQRIALHWWRHRWRSSKWVHECQCSGSFPGLRSRGRCVSGSPETHREGPAHNPASEWFSRNPPGRTYTGLNYPTLEWVSTNPVVGLHTGPQRTPVDSHKPTGWVDKNRKRAPQ